MNKKSLYLRGGAQHGQCQHYAQHTALPFSCTGLCYQEDVCYTPNGKGHFQLKNSLWGVTQGLLVNQALSGPKNAPLILNKLNLHLCNSMQWACHSTHVTRQSKADQTSLVGSACLWGWCATWMTVFTSSNMDPYHYGSPWLKQAFFLKCLLSLPLL